MNYERNLLLPLFLSLYLEIRCERVQTDTDDIELQWTYRLINEINYEDLKLTTDNLLSFKYQIKILKEFIATSSFITLFSGEAQSIIEVKVIQIRSINFNWDYLSDSINDTEGICKFDYDLFESSYCYNDIDMIQDQTLQNYVVIKFIYIAILQILNYYIYDFDSGKREDLLSNVSKAKILLNMIDHVNFNNNINIYKSIKLFRSSDDHDILDVTLFTSDSNFKTYCTSYVVICETINYFKKFKIIWEMVNKSNLDHYRHLIRNIRNESLYADELFLYNSLNSKQFNELKFEGVHQLEW